MLFQVPQFIDMEDKIIGPLTLKQFGYLAVAGIIIFILFSFLRMAFAIMLSVPLGALAFGLAFVKVKGMPLAKYLTSMIGFALKPQLYLWKKK